MISLEIVLLVFAWMVLEWKTEESRTVGIQKRETRKHLKRCQKNTCRGANLEHVEEI